jgi:hypothetical protein
VSRFTAVQGEPVSVSDYSFPLVNVNMYTSSRWDMHEMVKLLGVEKLKEGSPIRYAEYNSVSRKARNVACAA